MKKAIFGLATLALLSGTAIAQGTPDNATQNMQRTDTDNHHDYGWIGILGLAGLAGLLGRNRVHRHDDVNTRPPVNR